MSPQTKRCETPRSTNRFLLLSPVEGKTTEELGWGTRKTGIELGGGGREEQTSITPQQKSIKVANNPPSTPPSIPRPQPFPDLLCSVPSQNDFLLFTAVRMDAGLPCCHVGSTMGGEGSTITDTCPRGYRSSLSQVALPAIKPALIVSRKANSFDSIIGANSATRDWGRRRRGAAAA